jgi:LysM repeat protein
MTKEIKFLLVTFVILVGGIVYLEMQKRQEGKEIEPFEKEVRLVDPEPIKPIAKKPAPKPEPKKAEPKPEPKKVVVAPPPVPKAVPKPAPVIKKPEPKPVVKPAPKPVVVTKPQSQSKPLTADQKLMTKVEVNPTIPNMYVIKKGDILTQIAEQQLGSIHFVPDLLDANPELIPDRLLVGVELEMPSREELVQKAAQLNKKRFNVPGGYEIKKGDSLYSISVKELGSGKRVQEILKLNPGLNPQSLRVGDKIKLPK